MSEVVAQAAAIKTRALQQRSSRRVRSLAARSSEAYGGRQDGEEDVGSGGDRERHVIKGEVQVFVVPAGSVMLSPISF